MMTGEAGADPMLGYTKETEVQAAQDTPAQTDMCVCMENVESWRKWPGPLQLTFPPPSAV